MPTNDETPMKHSGRMTLFSGRAAKKVTLDRRCVHDPVSREFDFVLALSDFLAKQKGATRFDVYVCPKKRFESFQCCWQIDPWTGDLICVPCDEVNFFD
jgi:hypothetical protein